MTTSGKYIFISITLLICFLQAFSNNIKFEHLTTANGLSHNEVRVIQQDVQGFMWFGTQNGLTRYDGYRFKIFKHIHTDSTSLSHDKIYSLRACSDGSIWIGTLKGLNVIKKNSSQIINNFSNDSINNNLSERYIKQIYEGAYGNMWISYGSSTVVMSPSNLSIVKVFSNKDVRSLIGKHFNFIVLNNSIEILDSNFQKIDIKFNGLENQSIRLIRKTPDDRIIISTNRGIYISQKAFSARAKHISFSKISGITLTDDIASDFDNNIWSVSYGGGLDLIEKSSSSKFTNSPLINSSLSSNDCYSVYCDRSGVIWVGTQGGLDKFDKSKQKFITLNHIPSNKNSLSNNFIQYIYKDKFANYWFGTRDNAIDMVRFQNGDYTNPIVKNYSNSGDLSGAYVGGIYLDSKCNFWVASWSGGLNRVTNYCDNGVIDNYDKWRVIHYKNNPEDQSTICSNSVTSVIEDKKGRMWFSTTGGVALLENREPGKERFRNFVHNRYDPKSLPFNSCYSIFEDSQERKWVATNRGGLILMHEEKDGKIWFDNFVHDKNDSTSISNNEVFVVFEDSKNNIWVGTSYGGFNRLIEKQQNNGDTEFSFKRYTERHGLADNEVNAFLEDDYGYLWISTNKGISKFDPSKETIENFDEYDGVLKGKFRKNSAFKDDSGHLMFGGVAGVNIFHPKDFLNINSNLSVNSINIHYNNNLITSDKELIFEKDKGIKFEYSTLTYKSQKRIRYNTVLYHNNVIINQTSGSQPFTEFQNLESGNYKFNISVIGSDQKPLTINFSVRGVKYQWAYIIIILLIFAITIIFIRKPNKKGKAKTKQNFNDEDIKLTEKLEDLMRSEKYFLDNKLTLNDLAQKSGIKPNQLSFILNEIVGKSFYDYINSYRLEEFKHRLNEENSEKYTIISLAWDCGFYSKSSFNKFFKDTEGVTPSEYRKRITKK